MATALEELRTSGLVRHVGVCNFTAAQLEKLSGHAEVYSIQKRGLGSADPLSLSC